MDPAQSSAVPVPTKHDPRGHAGSGHTVDGPAVDGDASHKSNFFGMALASIGVVYGDIGTSPLYALRESLAHSKSRD